MQAFLFTTRFPAGGHSQSPKLMAADIQANASKETFQRLAANSPRLCHHSHLGCPTASITLLQAAWRDTGRPALSSSAPPIHPPAALHSQPCGCATSPSCSTSRQDMLTSAPLLTHLPLSTCTPACGRPLQRSSCGGGWGPQGRAAPCGACDAAPLQSTCACTSGHPLPGPLGALLQRPLLCLHCNDRDLGLLLF